jgi:hypothetical protein
MELTSAVCRVGGGEGYVSQRKTRQNNLHRLGAPQPKSNAIPSGTSNLAAKDHTPINTHNPNTNANTQHQKKHPNPGYALTQLQKFGAGFGIAVLAMGVAAAVEAYRKARAPPPAFYPTDPTDAAAIEYLRAHVSACRSLDDYNPFQFQQWWADNQNQQQPSQPSSRPPPANCRQVGAPLPGGASLPLASIACDSVPLVRACPNMVM